MPTSFHKKATAATDKAIAQIMREFPDDLVGVAVIIVTKHERHLANWPSTDAEKLLNQAKERLASKTKAKRKATASGTREASVTKVHALSIAA